MTSRLILPQPWNLAAHLFFHAPRASQQGRKIFDDPSSAFVTEKISPAEAVMLLHVEEMAVAKRQVTRTVRVTRQTRSRDTLVEEALTQIGVVIERVPMDQFVETMPPVREEGDLTILPVVEEVVVTTRRLRLVEEVRIRRTHTTAMHVETVKLREQHVVVTRSDPVILGEDAVPAAFTAYEPAKTLSTRSIPMTDETIVAVYDTAAHAEAAIEGLKAAGVPDSAISTHVETAGVSMGTTTTAPAREEGFWSSLFGGEPDHDTAVYDRSLASGSTVVAVKAPETHITKVMEILESHSPIDIDERATGYGLTQTTTTTREPIAASLPMSTPTSTMAATTGVAASSDEMLQLSEESLAVGKRVVNHGGTRIRRFVVETPVEESVSLHSEKVTLERHPVTDGRPVTDSFSEKTIEMTESAEEVVVSKTAHVYEEVGLRKEAADRVETVRDTVRKEEVEVEQIPGTTTTTTSGTTTAPLTPKI